MARDTKKYTRWTNNPDIDDDDEEAARIDAPLDQGEEGYNQMQEGRRVLAMMTPKPNQDRMNFSRPALGRIACTTVGNRLWGS